MKKVLSALLLLVFTAALCACGDPTPEAPKVEYTPEALAVLSDLDKNISVSPDAVNITLADGASTASGAGAEIEGDKITITNAGTYVFSGTLSNGQIAVKADKLHKVHLVFNGVWISNSETAPLYIISADKVIVTLAEGSKNHLTDISRPPVSTDDEEGEDNINACVYAADDLTFNGLGELTVEASNNGIGGKNDIRICGGTYAINAANNGIKGKDSVILAAGTISVVAGKDGVKSDNIEEMERGYVHICGGTISIQASDDGIQAVTRLTIDAGSVTVNATDDATNCDGTVSIKEGCLTDVNKASE